MVYCSAITTAFYTTEEFSIPACTLGVAVKIPSTSLVMVGAYLWNPTYGSYSVTSYDAVTGYANLVNECTAGNVDAGTVVPVCTPFLLVPQAVV